MVKVSVIIPVYNTEEYLDVCLDSLINQTFGDFEAICVNDGSLDNSLDILKKYSILDRRIKVYSKTNGGISSARNFGMKKSGGEYITFLDSDDFLSPVALERMYKNISENNSDFMFSYVFQICDMSGNIMELPSKKEFLHKIKTPVFEENDLNAEFYIKMLSTAWGKMYKREFVKDFEFPEGLIFEEFPFFANCWLSAKRISYDLEPLYFYRKHHKSDSEKSFKNYTDIFEINKMVDEIFKQHGKFEKYKTSLLVSQMESVLVRMMEAKGSVKRELFELFKEKYGSVNFAEYDMELLKRKNVYYAYQKIIDKSYRDFRHFEIRLGRNNGR